MPNTRQYAVWLHDQVVGKLFQRGDFTWFQFSDDYTSNAFRPVLGLRFENDLIASPSSHLMLPPWFSNLLPEGSLRRFISADRGISSDREMELLAQVGHDLPGAVRILPESVLPDNIDPPPKLRSASDSQLGNNSGGLLKFSLAGIGMKFSLLESGERFTAPASGDKGDWIVKMPDPHFADVPRNEYSMMGLAADSGIEVPPIRLVQRDLIGDIPPNLWPSGEDYAFAVRRFDRDADRNLIHIEDLAQVRDFYARDKYRGNFETIASLLFRGRDEYALAEFTRRLTFCILISNGDAHLKNWSLIYRDPRVPTISPAYDLVATGVYERVSDPEDLGLKFGKTKRFELIRLHFFDRLASKVGTGLDLASIADETIDRVQQAWPKYADNLAKYPAIRTQVERSISTRSKSLRQGVSIED